MPTRTLDHPHPLPAEAPALLELAPGILWLRLPLPWALNHINLWLLEDAHGYTLVDTGVGDEATRALWPGVLERLGHPLTRIVATHYHPDHLGNAQWLSARTGAAVAMSFGEYLLAHALHAQTAAYDLASFHEHFRRHGLDEERLARMAARGNIFRRGVPELPTRFRRIADGDVLEIGGRAWTAIAGHGHSPEHISLYCAEAGVLISGDMLLPRITPNISVPAAMPEEDSVGRFLGSLQRFRPLPPDTLVLPSHGLPFRGLHLRLDQLDTHHGERDDTILAALDMPHTAAEILPVLFPRPLDPHQLLFAMGEAIAHLNHLWLRGHLQCFEDRDGCLRFQQVS